MTTAGDLDTNGARQLGSHPQMMTVRQVAAILGIGVSTVWRAASKGDIPKPIKIGGSTRWRRADIEALVKGDAA